MAEPDRKPTPTLMVLLLALVGLFTVQRTATGPSSGAGSSASSPMAREGEGSAQRDDRAWDDSAEVNPRGVTELLDHALAPRPGGGVANEKQDADFPGLSEQAQWVLRNDLRCLIATLPHPYRSTSGYSFDEFVTALQRGVETRGYILDRYYFPWTKKPSKAASSKVELAFPWTAPDPPDLSRRQNQPGLIIFRNTDRTDANHSLLLVFLVPETATSGVSKEALANSLDWAKKFDGRKTNCTYFFNILGPSFSGSQASLEQALRTWLDEPGQKEGKSYDFQVVAGAAQSIDRDRLLSSLVPRNATLEFKATTHTNRLITQVVLDYLDVSQKNPVAMLVEAGTGFGQSASKTQDPMQDDHITYYQFPLNVGRIRAWYDKKGGGDTAGQQIFSAGERLKIGTGDPDPPTDVINPLRPDISTPVDELVLNEILQDIAHSKVKAVGITATDPRDVIFLARMVRRNVPDVRTFTTQHNLAFTHPDSIADLRGMLVASTYPLYPRNQAWSYSYRSDQTRVFFTSDNAQGTYNATVAQLLKLNDGKGVPQFLEYGNPFDAPWSPNKPRKPPVWMSIVGNHGIYPLHAEWEKKSKVDAWIKDDEYILNHRQTHEEFQALGIGDGARVASWFRPAFPSFHFWEIVFVTLSLACNGVVASVLILRCSAASVPTWFAPLAKFLNCEKEERSVRNEIYAGPGPYLAALLVLLLIIYLAIASYSCAAIPIPWLLTWSPWYQFFVCVGICTMMALMVGLGVEAPDAITNLSIWSGKDGVSRVCHLILIPIGILLFLYSALLIFIAIIFLLISWIIIWGVPSKPRRLMYGIFVTIMLIVVLVSDNFVARANWRAESWRGTEQKQVDALLAFERSMALPSGVSPVFPLLFLAAVSTFWVYAQLKRRYLLEQVTPKVDEDQPGKSRPPRNFDETTWDDMHTYGSKFQEGLHISKLFQSLDGYQSLVGVIAFWATLYLLFPLLAAPFKSGFWPYENIVGLLYCLFFCILTFHWLRLVLLWGRLRRLLKLAARLPLVRAMDRLPPRVARWFYEFPRLDDGRAELIQRQAQAFAAEFDKGKKPEGDASPLKQELATVAKKWGTDEAAASLTQWDRLRDNLQSSDQTKLWEARRLLRPVLLACWRDESVSTAFSEAPEPSTGKTGGTSESAGLRAIALALSQGKQIQEEPHKYLPDWLRAAEDLYALAILRWIAAGVSQLWLTIAILVFGALALLLAVSSYPFALQGHMFIGIGLLIVLIVVAVARVVVGVNCDELISRVANTAPHKLTPDWNLMASLFTYIVPLLGMLAALSFDASDTFRTLLDSLTRYLH